MILAPRLQKILSDIEPSSNTMSDPSGADRGVSEVVGVVVLFGMVMAGVALVFLTGSAVSDGVSERNQLRAAEQGLQEFDARATSLSNGADASSVAMGDNIEGAATVDRDDELVAITGDSTHLALLDTFQQFFPCLPAHDFFEAFLVFADFARHCGTSPR